MGRALRKQVPRKSLGRLGGAGRPAGPGPADRGVARGPARRADPDPGRPDGRLAVRVPARHRDRDGRGRRRAAGHRDHPGDLRRRAPGQLRLLRLARGRARDRPQRLRRGPSRRLGVGPAAAGRQHLGGRAGELVAASSSAQTPSRRASSAYRAEVALPGRPAAAACAPTTGWTSSGCTRPPPRRRCGRRSSGPPSGPGTGPATGRCRGSPASTRAGGASSTSRR